MATLDRGSQWNLCAPRERLRSCCRSKRFTLNELPQSDSARRVGAKCASRLSMVQDHRDLVIWQLARSLRLVLQLTRRRPALFDRDFVGDIRRSARSVVSNTAEGHARFRPKDNHRFLLIARASLKETEEHFGEGLENDYFSKEEHATAHRLIKRITVAMASLMRYLRSPAAEENRKRIEGRQQTRGRRPRTS
jgi:four helix bundle protein